MRTVGCLLIIALMGCGGRSPTNVLNDGGVSADGPYLVDDAGNVVLDDGGNPIPVPQDAALGDAPADGPAPVGDAAQPQQDSGATPGVIPCGATTCDATTQQCCVSQPGATCIDQAATCQGLPVTCDGPEDCPGGEPICCATLGGGGGGTRGVTCTTDCPGLRLCRLDTDCASGDRCCGSGTVANVTATWCEPAARCPNTTPTVGVACDTATCTTPQVCCRTFAGQTCTAADACQGLSLACDGPEDCSGGTPVCCGQLSAGGSGTQCVADGTCASGTMGSGIVCHVDGDCPDNGTCTTLTMVNVRICR